MYNGTTVIDVHGHVTGVLRPRSVSAEDKTKIFNTNAKKVFPQLARF